MVKHIAIAALLAVSFPVTGYATDAAVLAAEQAAFQRAALSASPSVVTIETIGGFDKLGNVRLNTGATTGTIVGRDGWIISSAFNLAGDPQAIFVTLDDGRRVAAERIATDTVRQLVLLKANATDLTPVQPAPEEDIVVGRWAIAVGRTYGTSPNVSVGLVSALGRIGGLAIQTDAKVSPTNYGGPLLDVDGKALGLLVPMSPKTTAGGGELAGIEWYDSGIGFAVPMTEAVVAARRLQAGEDLKKGRMGISFVGTGLLDEPAEVKAIHPLGPADVVGIKPGDVVVSANGQPVDGLRQLKAMVAGLYADDELALEVKRGDETFAVSIKLAAELPVYEFPWLGTIVDIDRTGRPVVRAALTEDCPLKAGDVVTKIGDVEIGSAAEAQRIMQRRFVADPVEITVLRDGKSETVKLVPQPLTGGLPDELVAPTFDAEIEPDDDLIGRWTGEVLDGQVTFWAYNPPATASGYRPGLVVWLADGGTGLLPAVRSACHERNIALLVPSPSDDDWGEGDSDAVLAAIAAVRERLQKADGSPGIDGRRVAIVASGNSARLALAIAQDDKSPIRGIVVNKPKFKAPPSPVSPDRRLMWGIIGDGSGREVVIAKFLQKDKHPVTILPDVFENGKPFIRWVDYLGRW